MTTLVGTTTATITSGAGNQTVNFSGGAAQVDDVVHISLVNITTAATTPVGYTEIATEYFDQHKVFRKVLTGTDSSVAIPRDAGGAAAALIAIWRTADTTTPEDATPTEIADASTVGGADPPAITTVTDAAPVAAYIGTYADNGITAGPSTYGDFATITDGGAGSVGFAWKEKATAGAENPGVFTHTNDPALWIAITVAIRPAAGGAPPIVCSPLNGMIVRGARRVGRVVAGTAIVIPTLHQVLHYSSKVI